MKMWAEYTICIMITCRYNLDPICPLLHTRIGVNSYALVRSKFAVKPLIELFKKVYIRKRKLSENRHYFKRKSLFMAWDSNPYGCGDVA